jgi:hypothetical protein
LARFRAELAPTDPPADVAEVPDPRARPASEGPGDLDRRRVGVVMVVLLILVVATLTLSLLLRHGPAGPGLT